MGTAGYMAPEQAAGRTKDVGRSADVYALGAILYEGLTGRPPFQAETWDVIRHKVVHEEPRPPCRLRPEVPADLDAVCLKCLAKEPGERYASAAELADDLQRFQAGQPVTALAVSDREWLVRWARRLGYELLEEIGRGPVGEVYLVRHAGMDGVLALKVHRPHPGGAASRQAQAQGGAYSFNPNIVPVYDFGNHEGLHYFTMGYVDGGNLTRLIGSAPDPGAAAALIRSLVEALHTSHRLHGNLKPTNVLLSRDAVPMLTDFWLARYEPGQAVPPRAEPDAAAAGYLAPEQAAGQPEALGPATDVYGMGALLYSMLTGRPPFRGASARETLEQVAAQEPVPPRQLRPEVPPGLEAVCLKCLHKAPSRRYSRSRHKSPSRRAATAR
jgi:serine/threonine protein kinase